MSTQQLFCSDLSAQSQEEIIGTATPTSAYLLLEYPHAWGPKAIPESMLPENVKSWLYEQTGDLLDAKALLIRQESWAPEPSGIHFFVVAAREQNPALYAFQLERYEDLLSLDVSAILTGDTAYETQRSADPLLLVCTHGRRDACCARDGQPVNRTLQEAIAQDTPQIIWQVSHIGGHRFAANLVCLPHGLLYGRVNPQTAIPILNAYQRGRVYLPNLRGRSCYPKIAQVAEYHLREVTGEMRLSVFQLKDTIETDPGSWQIQFSTVDPKATYRLRLHVEETGGQVYQGCKLDKLAPQKRYRLVNYSII